MFWKKGAKKPVPQHNQPLFEAPRERRRYYRVAPSSDAPVQLHVDNQSFRLQNVSAGGGAFFAEPKLPPGTRSGWLELPDGEPAAIVTLEVLRKKPGPLCHCRFLDVPQMLENRIFRYVFEREKQLIRDGQA